MKYFLHHYDLAAGAKVAGATAADTLAIATALQAVGVQSQAGGTAMARVFQAITIALQGGGKELASLCTSNRVRSRRI